MGQGKKSYRVGTRNIGLTIDGGDYDIYHRYASILEAESGKKFYAKNIMEELIEQGAELIKKQYPAILNPKRNSLGIKLTLKPKK